MNACEKAEALAKHRGYIGQFTWLEKMSKQFTQIKCDKCNKYHIWKKKERRREYET